MQLSPFARSVWIVGTLRDGPTKNASIHGSILSLLMQLGMTNFLHLYVAARWFYYCWVEVDVFVVLFSVDIPAGIWRLRRYLFVPSQLYQQTQWQLVLFTLPLCQNAIAKSVSNLWWSLQFATHWASLLAKNSVPVHRQWQHIRMSKSIIAVWRESVHGFCSLWGWTNSSFTIANQNFLYILSRIDNGCLAAWRCARWRNHFIGAILRMRNNRINRGDSEAFALNARRMQFFPRFNSSQPSSVSAFAIHPRG